MPDYLSYSARPQSAHPPLYNQPHAHRPAAKPAHTPEQLAASQTSSPTTHRRRGRPDDFKDGADKIPVQPLCQPLCQPLRLIGEYVLEVCERNFLPYEDLALLEAWLGAASGDFGRLLLILHDLIEEHYERYGEHPRTLKFLHYQVLKRLAIS